VDLPDEAQALLALPPARFTAERDAVAARLAATGDPAAAAVRKLRRPVGLAWVLNRLALERPREVEGLLAAGDEVRAGTRRAVSGAGAGALRDAEQALRERARRLRLEAERLLAAEGRPPSAAALGRVELLLRVAALGDERDALRSGSLLREPEVGAADLSGFTVVAGGAARAGSEGGVRAPSANAAREVRNDRAREREARAKEERELRERRRAIAAARAEAARADRRAAQEARRAGEAERRAREARERAASAKAEADRLNARALELERGRSSTR
jgi:hypothetical protein